MTLHMSVCWATVMIFRIRFLSAVYETPILGPDVHSKPSIGRLFDFLFHRIREHTRFTDTRNSSARNKDGPIYS